MLKLKTATAFLFLLFYFLPQFSHATESKWATELPAKPDWIKVTPIGIVIGASASAIFGIDPSTGKTLWEINEIKNCPVEAYQPIADSPLILLEGKSNSVVNGNVLKERLYLVNPVTGNIVFSSNTSGMKDADQKHFLNNVGLAILFGKPSDGKGLLSICVDLKAGKLKWSKLDKYKYTTNIFAINKDEILLTSFAFITKINANTGDEIWRKPLEQKYSKMESWISKTEKYAPKTPEEQIANIYFPYGKQDMCIVGTQRASEPIGSMPAAFPYVTIYVALNYNTGEYLWKNEVNFDYPIGMASATDEGFLITSGSSGHYNMIDYTSGEYLIGKKKFMLSMPDFKSVIGSIDVLNNKNILFVGKGGKKAKVNIFSSAEKKMIFEKSAEIKGEINFIQESGNNIIIGTDEMLGLLNSADGQWLSETEFKTSTWLVAQLGEKFYLFANKTGILYEMPVGSSAAPKALNAPALFGSKELADRMDIIDNNIVVSSAQNIAKIGTDGKVTYNKNFPPPENSLLVKTLQGSLLLASTYAMGMLTTQLQVMDYKNKHNLQFIKYNALKDMGNEHHLDNAIKIFNEGGGAEKMTEIFTKRFSKTTMSIQSQIVVTEDEQKVLNDAKIKAIDKSTGEIKLEVGLGKDVKPVYDVDFIDGLLFYLKDSKNLICYNIK